MSKILRKYGLRILVSTFIYLFFRITSGSLQYDLNCSTATWPVLLPFTIFVVLIVWEVCDRVIIYFARQYPQDLSSKRRLAVIFAMVTLATFPLVTGFIYFENYQVKTWLNCIKDLEGEFWADLMQGYVVTWLVISVEILKVYYQNVKNMEIEQARMQKELMRTQYESLKNQVNPHFLFNNFSVLTALIYQDADLASDFVTKLSKLYRYILDNKENEMVSLEKEFEFLDSYLFLLKTRHEESLHVEKKVNINPADFYVPTLSLQMLIENAVKHNNFSREKPLVITIYNENDQFIVVQNGLNRKAGITHSTRIGLENIKNRYTLKSDKKVMVYQSEQYFKVKLPILPSLSLSQ